MEWARRARCGPTEDSIGACYGSRVDRAEAAGRLLAERHRNAVEADTAESLLNVAESARIDDWTLRSALVRFAQPEPTRAGAVLELVRRSSAALQSSAAAIERHVVNCVPTLSIDDLASTGDRWELEESSDPHPDGRVFDIARLCASSPEEANAILAAYRSDVDVELEPEEEAVLPLLPAVLALDHLADSLAAWAVEANEPPPLAVVDETCRSVFELMEELGTPAEDPAERRRPGR